MSDFGRYCRLLRLSRIRICWRFQTTLRSGVRDVVSGLIQPKHNNIRLEHFVALLIIDASVGEKLACYLKSRPRRRVRQDVDNISGSLFWDIFVLPQVYNGLPSADHLKGVISYQHFRRQGAAIVGGRHNKTVCTGASYGHEISLF